MHLCEANNCYFPRPLESNKQLKSVPLPMYSFEEKNYHSPMVIMDTVYLIVNIDGEWHAI